jgi:thiol-disulfide isomerase/thioredoxin
MNAHAAPELQVSQWFNQDQPLSLALLRGKVVILHAFQMLCPGCVSHGVPQAERLHKLFPRDKVQVIGLHTVFEHHAVMTPAALAVFLREYRISHPVAVDQVVAGQAIPATMQAYHMQGTPTLVLIDREGRLATQQFGSVEDMRLGALVGQLLD